MPDLRQEFFFQSGSKGCLVIHGFTSTPAEVYELGCRIHQAGYTVLGIKLKGHGTDLADFTLSTEHDWIESARDGLKRLRAICQTVYVAGHSMGGLLALYLAEHDTVDKLMLLAPALVYRSPVSYLAGVGAYFIKEIAWPVVERTPEEKQYALGYPSFPVASVEKMTRLQRMVRKDLSRVNTEVLLIVAKKDRLVHPVTASVLRRHLKCPLQVVWLAQSGHSVGVESEKETVFEACLTFLREK